MGFGRCHVPRSSLPDCGQLDNRRYPLDITTSFYLGAQMLRLLWAEEETDMTSSNLNSWSRLGFLGDEGKESHHYMGQREASCNCDQNVPNRMSYLDSRWDDGASSQLTPKGQSWQKPEQTKVIAQPPISSGPSILCVIKASGCLVLAVGHLGFPTDMLTCLWEFAALGQTSWAQKSDNSAPI